MRNFLYVINKRYKNDTNANESISKINQLKNVNHKFSNYHHKNIECYAYTNENIELVSNIEDYYFAFSGQLPSNDEEIQRNIKENEQIQSYIGNLPGAYIISFLNIQTDTIRVFTTINRVNNVFYCENEDKIVIGADPLIVNCFAYNKDKPIFDLKQSVSFISNGYFTDDNTLFKNTYAVPANTVVTIENERMTFEKIDNSIEKMFTKNPTDEDYDDLTQAYLNAFEIVPNSNKPHNVGLTGGKDSRLITLGLLEKGLTFKANTRGYDDHPDVIIAKQIAEKLKLDYSVKRPKTNTENILVIDIIDKILKTMIGTSGTLYGYENLNYSTEYIGNTGITGVGAETIRGGYGALKKRKNDNIGDEFVKAFYPFKNYFLPEVRQPYEYFLRNFGEHEKSVKEAQSKHYMFYNVGRRTAGSRIAALYYSNSLSPFFDNRFIKKVTELNIDILTSERLHYNLTAKLNKEIADMPLAGSRWEFEANKPLTPDQYRDWIQRQPVYAKTKKGAYNYRQLSNEDTTLLEAFKSILLNDPSSEIFSIVDEDMLRELLNKPIRPMLNRFIWSLASVKIYMDYYNNKLNYGIGKLEFHAPESIEEGVKYPETRDLMDSMRTFNDAVSLEEYGKYIKIKINPGSKSNKYFQTGNGGFNIPSNTPKGLLAIPERISKINAKLYFESSSKDAAIELYIIQYDDNSKIKSQSKTFTVQDGKILIDFNLKLQKETKNIKFAFRIDNTSDMIIAKYAFMKLQ